MAFADPQLTTNTSMQQRWLDSAALIRATPWDAAVVAGDLCDSWTSAQETAFDAGYDAGTPNLRQTVHVAWGNHDVGAARTASWAYIGAPLGGPSVDAPYHSFDMPNGWHIVCADFSRPTSDLQAGSDQLAWLEADLDANPEVPTMVVYHIGRYTGEDGRDPGNASGAACFAELLARPWVEAVISGHSHMYERFARMNNSGAVDTVNGIRQFNLGSCGIESTRVQTSPTGLEAWAPHTQHGVTLFTLNADSYEWETISPTGYEDEAITDTGSQTVRYPL